MTDREKLDEINKQITELCKNERYNGNCVFKHTADLPGFPRKGCNCRLIEIWQLSLQREGLNA